MYTVTAAAAAKSLQSCPTLCDTIDGSQPGSLVPGILQARILEWVAISFSNSWKWKVKVKSLSRVWLSDPMDCSYKLNKQGDNIPPCKKQQIHSSTLAWKIPQTEMPGRLQSMGSQSQIRLSDFTFTFTLCKLSILKQHFQMLFQFTSPSLL